MVSAEFRKNHFSDDWWIFFAQVLHRTKNSSNIEIPCKHPIDTNNGDGTNDARDAKGCSHELIDQWQNPYVTFHESS